MASARRHIDDRQRRARIARRHGIAPAHRLADVEAATRAMTVLHATEAAMVYLSAFARVDGLAREEVDRALYVDRSLVKQLAMRRTLFLFPRDLLPAAVGSAAARVAEQAARRVAKDVEASGLAADGAAWLDRACEAVLDRLSGSDGLTAQQVREQVPQVQGKITMAPGRRWGGEVQVAPWVLTQLGARGLIVRGPNAGHWRLSKPTWTLTSRWLGEVPEAMKPEEGYAVLVRHWLRTFGPGTAADLQWWLGSTKTAVTQALASVGAVEVGLDGPQPGWVLPDDTDPEPDVEPWAALLPVLDATAMGWRHREFYLDPADVPFLVDSNGNIGSTAWWDGRVVGCWVQDEDAVVRVVLRHDVGADGKAAMDAEAARLTAWLDGTRISSVYSSLQMKQARLP